MKKTLLFIYSLLLFMSSFSQNERSLTGFIGTAIPLVSISNTEFSSNFTPSASLVFPVGFNLNTSPKFSYSIELDPVIIWSKNGASVVNLALLPGVLLHGKKTSYGIRAAFETAGRFGLSLSVLKNLKSFENFNLVIGLPLDIRTGNNSPMSLGTGIIVVATL